MSCSGLPFPSNDLASPGSSTVRAPFPPYAPRAQAHHASRHRCFRQTVFASSAILPAGCLYGWVVPCCCVLLGAMNYRTLSGWLGQQAGYTFHCAKMWGANHFDRDTTICLYIKAENKFLQLLPCPTWAAMDCVFDMYMRQEDKGMVMTLYMTVVKQHSQHIMTPTKQYIWQ
jgi:hypothetical protein